MDYLKYTLECAKAELAYKKFSDKYKAMVETQVEPAIREFVDAAMDLAKQYPDGLPANNCSVTHYYYNLAGQPHDEEVPNTHTAAKTTLRIFGGDR